MIPRDDGPEYPPSMSADGKTCSPKVDGFQTESTGWMKVEDVWGYLQDTMPGAITTAGTAYSRTSKTLFQQADRFVEYGKRLSEAWGGSVAVQSIGQLGQLHDTASNLASGSDSIGAALSWHGPNLQSYKSLVKWLYDKKQSLLKQLAAANATQRYDQSHPLAGRFAMPNPNLKSDQSRINDLQSQIDQIDQSARDLMNSLNDDTQTVWSSLPSELKANLPSTK